MPAVVPPGFIRTRRTFANLVHVVGGEAILCMANFVAAVLIARLRGTVAFGFCATTLAYAIVAAMLADNGLGISTVRSIGPIVIAPAKPFTQYAVIKILLFVPMLGGLNAVGLFARLSPLSGPLVPC